MRFSVTVPGQPVSWDTAYITGQMPVMRHGKPVLRPDGTQRMIHRPVKTEAAQTWQNDVQLIVQNARKPKGWAPKGQIRVTIDLHLSHPMDADNAVKLILDAVAKGIGYNDSHFLHCIRSMEAGLRLRDARVDLMIDDDPTHP